MSDAGPERMAEDRRLAAEALALVREALRNGAAASALVGALAGGPPGDAAAAAERVLLGEFRAARLRAQAGNARLRDAIERNRALYDRAKTWGAALIQAALRFGMARAEKLVE